MADSATSTINWRPYCDYYTNETGLTAVPRDPNSVLLNFALTSAGATSDPNWYNVIGDPGNGNVPINYEVTTQSGLTIYFFTATGSYFSGGDVAASDTKGIDVGNATFEDGFPIPQTVMKSNWYNFNTASEFAGLMFFYIPGGYKAQIEIKGGFNNGNQFSNSNALVRFVGDTLYERTWDPINAPLTVLKTSAGIMNNANGRIDVQVGAQNQLQSNIGPMNCMKIKLIQAAV